MTPAEQAIRALSTDKYEVDVAEVGPYHFEWAIIERATERVLVERVSFDDASQTTAGIRAVLKALS